MSAGDLNTLVGAELWIRWHSRCFGITEECGKTLLENYIMWIEHTQKLMGDPRVIVSSTVDAKDDEGPGEEDGPWAEGWEQRSQPNAEVKQFKGT